MVPKGLTNELLELEQELIAKVEVRGKETTRGEKEERLRKFSEGGLAEAFAELSKLLKSLKTWTSTPKGFL